MIIESISLLTAVSPAVMIPRRGSNLRYVSCPFTPAMTPSHAQAPLLITPLYSAQDERGARLPLPRLVGQ